jgi:ketosteroid isomerase-like protein
VITADALARQEAVFADAFAAKDLARAADLYDPEVVYLSPTVRLFGWPRRIVGRERTLEFIGLTIRACEAIRYEAVEWALVEAGAAAFVRIHFDWTRDRVRLRSSYVVLYRYRDGRIVQQELYYDPDAPPDVLGPPPGGSGSGRA